LKRNFYSLIVFIHGLYILELLFVSGVGCGLWHGTREVRLEEEEKLTPTPPHPPPRQDNIKY